MGFGHDFNGFYLPVSVRQAAATAAGAVVWTMRNTGATGAAKKVDIISIDLTTLNDGAAGGPSHYQLCRFTAATPTGGAALTPVRMRTLPGVFTTIVTDARQLATGLTMGAAVLGAPFAELRGGAAANQRWTMDMRDPERMWPGFELQPGEGLAIVLGTVAVIGQGIFGNVHWVERL